MRILLGIPPLHPPRKAGTIALAALLVALPANTKAQQPPVIPVAHKEALQPAVRINGVQTVRSLAEWPGVSITANRESHVVMFAVTRGRHDIPLQVLSPRRPRLDTRVREGRTVQARPLGRREMLHLVNFGEAPLVVAFASTVKPDLDQFQFGPEWADDLLLDTLVSSQEELLEVLGRTVFGPDAEFSVAVATAPNPTPLSRYAESWYFDNMCAGYSSYYGRRSALGWFGGVMINDFMLAREPGWAFQGYGSFLSSLGAFSMFPGGLFSMVASVTMGTQFCRDYRIAWAPIIAPVIPPPRIPSDSVTVPSDSGNGTPGTPGASGAGARHAQQMRGLRAERSENPGGRFEASAWRRGETGSNKRFPAVMAEERPWNVTRALPSQWTGTSANATARERAWQRNADRSVDHRTDRNTDRNTDRVYDRSDRDRAFDRNGRSRFPSAAHGEPRAASPTRGREFPNRGTAETTGTEGRESGRREAPPQRAEPAPPPARADGAIIPPSPTGQSAGQSAGQPASRQN